MGFFLAIILGIFVVGNVTNESIIKEKISKVVENKKVISKIKPDIKKQEQIKEVENSVKQNTNWLKLALYILGSIFAIFVAKIIYSRVRSNPPLNNASDYMRTKFKDEVSSDNTEQQPAQEEVSSDNTEQQPKEEDDNKN